MKTERRHELQTNELAIWLSTTIDRVKPYTKVITGVVLLGLVVLVLFTYVQNRRERLQGEAWSAYFAALDQSDPETFADVASAYPETAAGLWARQSAGDAYLASGASQMFRDRTTAMSDLEKAQEAYQQVVADATNPMLRQRAYFGLAQTLETLGKLDEAVAEYKKISAEWPDAAIAKLAEQRAADLQRDETRQWYSWFAEHEPEPSPLDDPSLFQDLPNLPEAPDISLPQPGELIPGTVDEPSDSQPTDNSGSDTSTNAPAGPSGTDNQPSAESQGATGDGDESAVPQDSEPPDTSKESAEATSNP